MSRVFQPSDTLGDLLLEHPGWRENSMNTSLDQLSFVMEFENGARRRYTVVTHIDNDMIPQHRH